jgi:hypothetical protein
MEESRLIVDFKFLEPSLDMFKLNQQMHKLFINIFYIILSWGYKIKYIYQQLVDFLVSFKRTISCTVYKT